MSYDATPAPPGPRTSAAWREAFRANSARLLEIPWSLGAGLSGAERAVVARSVQAFQLGESSEGRHLMRRARAHSERTGEADYVEAVRLFIAEEHRHARDLDRFLDLAGIPRLRAHWVDAVFRLLRRLAGLELLIAVLITAEVIAKVYYLALREATGSAVLRRLCDQILRDEAEHVRFQAERLGLLRIGRSRPGIGAAIGSHRLFLAATCLVVWHDHGGVLRAGGFGFGRFLRACRAELDDAARQMDPGPAGAACPAPTVA